MKNTNNTAVKNVLTKFNSYVLMVSNDDAIQAPTWMSDLGNQIKDTQVDDRKLGQIYASLRQGMIKEYGTQVSAHLLNNTFSF